MSIDRRGLRGIRWSVPALERFENRVLMATGPSLGAAASFAVLGGTTVTNTGATAIVGNVGVSPGTAITGFPPGNISVGSIHAGDATATQAEADLVTAYNNLAGDAVDTDLSGQDLGGKTLTPGVYHFSTSAQLGSALTLDAQGDPNAVFVFQIGTTLTTASESSVNLINGARAGNVFWQVGSSATLGLDTSFQGSILAYSNITMTTGVSMGPGRALAINGAVTLDTNSVSTAFMTPLTITALNETKVYGAALPALEVSYSGFTNGETSASLTTLPTLSTTATASSPAGTYDIIATGAIDPEYTISYVVGTLTITPAPLTITANDQTRVAGSSLPTLTASYTGFVNGDSSTDLTTPVSLGTTATINDNLAGSTFPITASGAVDPNYTISEVNGTLTVTPASATTYVIVGPLGGPIGTPESFTLTAEDPFGNVATGYAGMAHFTSNDPLAVLPGDASLTNGMGTFFLTFQTLGLDSITATDTEVGGITATASGLTTTTVFGTVYLDLNANGVPDVGERGLVARVVFLDLNHTGTFDLGDPTATTDVDGHFSFSGVASAGVPVLEAPDQDISGRYVVDQSTTNLDGTVSIGVVPYSPVSPVKVVPSPFSPEPAADANTAFVQSLYKAELGRVGGPNEVDSWLVKMNSGMTRSQVTVGFVNSLEHRQDQVHDYYAEFLHRTPDPLSSTWVNDLLNGVSEETVAEAILDSPEYQSAHQDPALFVQDLYLDVLGRQGDSGGLSGWQAALTGGMTREDVVAQFVQSTEAIDQMVDSFYTAFLHRRPESETTIWVSILESPNGSATDVAAGILASPEFNQKAQTSTI